jgi:hypothetical protein
MKTPAFPQQFNGTTEPSLSGMTLRDYFAAKAMQGWLLVPKVAKHLDGDFEGVATWSYHMADAMMKARTE